MIQFSSLKAMTFNVFTIKKKFCISPVQREKKVILPGNLELLIPL